MFEKIGLPLRRFGRRRTRADGHSVKVTELLLPGIHQVCNEELTGFARLLHEGVHVGLGFTATVNTNENAGFVSWITVIWSMVASACLTLGAIYALVWSKNRSAWAYLLFAMTAASTAAFTFCELRQMRVATPGELLSAMKWTHVALLCLLVSTVWFVRLYLDAGRRWLAWTVCGLRASYLLVAFLIWGNVNSREITSVQRVPFLGDSVTVFTGIPNPWMLLGYATMLVLLIFVADAGVTAWRRGERRKALMVGGSVEFFLFLGTIQAALIHWAHLPLAVLVSPLYLGLVVMMAFELSRDVLRSSLLVQELQVNEARLRESEARMSLAVDAAEKAKQFLHTVAEKQETEDDSKQWVSNRPIAFWYHPLLRQAACGRPNHRMVA